MSIGIVLFSLFAALSGVFAAGEPKTYSYEIMKIELNSFAKSDKNPVYQVSIVNDGVVSLIGVSQDILNPIMLKKDAVQPDELVGFRFQSRWADATDAIFILSEELREASAPLAQ